MAFITHVLTRHSRHLLKYACIAVCGAWSVGVCADEFITERLNTRLVDRVYLLDADITFTLSETAREALGNGLPLTIMVAIDIQRKRKWWLDARLAELEQRYQIHYHALTHQYTILNLNSGAFANYPTLDVALYRLGRIRDFPLLDEKLTEPGEHYEIELQASLDIEALPSPLRPLAYLNPSWYLNSGWVAWSLKP